VSAESRRALLCRYHRRPLVAVNNDRQPRCFLCLADPERQVYVEPAGLKQEHAACPPRLAR